MNACKAFDRFNFDEWLALNDQVSAKALFRGNAVDDDQNDHLTFDRKALLPQRFGENSLINGL